MDEYVQKAVELANNSHLILAAKNNLRSKFEKSKVFKHKSLTQNLEKAFVNMWHIYCASNA